MAVHLSGKPASNSTSLCCGSVTRRADANRSCQRPPPEPRVVPYSCESFQRFIRQNSARSGRKDARPWRSRSALPCCIQVLGHLVASEVGVPPQRRGANSNRNTHFGYLLFSEGHELKWPASSFRSRGLVALTRSESTRLCVAARSRSSAVARRFARWGRRCACDRL